MASGGSFRLNVAFSKQKMYIIYQDCVDIVFIPNIDLHGEPKAFNYPFISSIMMSLLLFTYSAYNESICTNPSLGIFTTPKA